jgi:hypothetical protein
LPVEETTVNEHRRLSDKILAAFHQACSEGSVEVAEELFRALEAALTAHGGAGVRDRRDDVAFIAAARDKLTRLRAEKVG